MPSNLPPGVSDSDIPGNRPEDIAAEDFAEQEAAYYRAAIDFYGLEGAHQIRDAIGRIRAPDGYFQDMRWCDDIDDEVEAEDLKSRIAEEMMYLGEVLNPEDELRAREAIQRMEARLASICHATYPETSAHMHFCPQRVSK